MRLVPTPVAEVHRLVTAAPSPLGAAPAGDAPVASGVAAADAARGAEPGTGTITPVTPGALPPTRLPLHVVAGWGLGTLAGGILFNTTGMLLLRYLTDYLGLAAGLAGLLVAASKIYDALTDPVMGWISDNTRSRFGRRRPWLLAGAVLCALAMIALFNVPGALGSTALVAWVVFALLFYATAYTVLTVPYMAMPGEMTTDYHERARLMSWRVGFVGVAQVVAGYAAPMLVLAYGDGARGHGLMSMTLAVAVLAAGVACFALTRSAQATGAAASLPKASGAGAARPLAAPPVPPVPLGRQLRAVAGNRPFVLLILSKFALLLSVASFGATFAYFVVHVLQATYALLGTFTVVSTAAMLGSLPVWVKVIRRVDKRRAFMIAAVAYALLALSWLLAGPGEPTAALLLRAAAMGVLGCGTLLAGQALLPDAIEYDYLRHGERREALFAGFYTMAEKFASALGVAVTGLFLGAMGYVSSSAGVLVRQPDSALLGIAFAVGAIPAAMLLTSAALIYFYDLGERRLVALREAAHGTGSGGSEA
jgi:GPH family glycoside/pentoside/hexuronide:cation symporter